MIAALAALAVTALTAAAVGVVALLVKVLRDFTADDRHYAQTVKGHRS